jgi:hypothetical protein
MNTPFKLQARRKRHVAIGRMDAYFYTDFDPTILVLGYLPWYKVTKNPEDALYNLVNVSLHCLQLKCICKRSKTVSNIRVNR